MLIVPKEDMLSLLMDSDAKSSRVIEIYNSHMARLDADPSDDLAREELISMCRSAASHYQDQLCSIQ